MNNKLKAALGILITVLLFSFALYVLHRELGSYQYSQIIAQLRNIPQAQVIKALGLTILSYLVLTLYDFIAITYVGKKLPYRKIAMASFVGYTFSHNLGFSMVTGGAARFRLFSLWGLSSIEIAQAIAYSGIVFWIGFCFLTGFVILVDPPTLPIDFFQSSISLRVLGAVLFSSSIFIYYIWVVKQREICIKSWIFVAPRSEIFLSGILVACIDWILAASVTYVLLPKSSVSFVHFVGIFQLSQVTGLVSNVPGGLGVFEAMVLLFFGHAAKKDALIGALLVYRLVYYILPLCTSLTLFLIHELLHNFKMLAKVTDRVHKHLSSCVPLILAVLTFVSGGVLLFSSATPAIEDRIAWLKDVLPLLFVELSHFSGSVIGVTLLILARGLYLRLNASYWLALVLTSLGAAVSLFKGFDFEEAILLLTIFYLLFISKKYFYRKTKILDETFSFTWFLFTALVLVAVVWLVFFRYKHVEYSHSLWWELSFYSDAPRSLRATLGAFCFLLLFAVLKLLTPARPVADLTPIEELVEVKSLLPEIPQTYSALSLLGDKQYVFSNDKKSFIMYATEGRSWIAMGDPLGNENNFPELIWNFREQSDEVAADCVFYEVSSKYLPLYIDIGLDFLKLGEEAIINLQEFNLDGKKRASLRHSRNKLRNEDWKLVIKDESQFAEVLPQITAISNSWLKEKSIREKSFSLGNFNPEYLKNFPIALIQKGEQIIAFANIWKGNGKYELSVDLMRHSQSAPNGVMDFLFIELMLWGKEQGYERFNLGMAPFSGLDPHQLAPLWNKIGRILYKHGEKYYNFQGLRKYKEKFDPVWEQKYLAAPGGLNLARVMTNIATVVSSRGNGGVKVD
ncbi:MAG: bifunctional lysylphosphatidylglycerol flippase/synthetase MprF [Proteobacteria bacterium]|nr:bifunctional lysylphosphatidylglycerol flippase/synthetase MprF [Pseudomonadota bacterium]